MLAENKIRVTAIQRLCVHDGPGVRTTVFLKGCYLQCPWCCNPETINYEEDALYNKGICKKDKSSIVCLNCVLCGGTRFKEECPMNAYENTYADYGIEELFVLLMRDKNIYENGGGITFSGGEPLYQATSLIPLLQKLKKNGIHIAFETSLYAPYLNLRQTMPYVDYWLIDLKFQYGYIRNPNATSANIDIERNLTELSCCGNPNTIHYRMVVMGEIIGKFDTIIEKLKKHHISQIELLGYHSLGKSKYQEVGKQFHVFTPLEKEQVEYCMSLFYKNQIKASFLSI